MTRNDYTDMFDTASDAVEFETQALSIGDEFLPAGARTVRDGGEPTPEYWSWLAGQANDGLPVEPAKPETVEECLRAVRNTDGWCVVDPTGGVWWPHEDAAEEIEADTDPAGRAVRLCAETPVRGTWRD